MAGSRSKNGCGKEICKSVLGSFFTLCGLMLLSLVLRPSNPECFMEKLYIPSLDKASSNDTQIINSTSISFDLTFTNSNDVAKFFYVDTINMTFYYHGNNVSTIAIANISLPKFNLAHKGSARRVETIEAFGVPWKGARLLVSNGSTTEFTVDADTKFRYTYWYWISEKFLRSKIHRMRLAANISVNDQGVSVKDKLELSKGHVHVRHRICTAIVALFSLFQLCYN